MAKKKQTAKETVEETKQLQETAEEKETQQQEPPAEEKPKDTRILYAGPTISNEKFFLRKGQIFTEVPLYVPEELKQFFIPLSDYSPEKEKELEKLRRDYLKRQSRKKNQGGK